MEIALTPELEQFVAEQIVSGAYPTPSALVNAGVRMLQDRERLREARFQELAATIRREFAGPTSDDSISDEEVFHRLKAKIQAGREDLDAGRFEVLDEHTFDRIRAMGERLLAESRKCAS